MATRQTETEQVITLTWTGASPDTTPEGQNPRILVLSSQAKSLVKKALQGKAEIRRLATTIDPGTPTEPFLYRLTVTLMTTNDVRMVLREMVGRDILEQFPDLVGGFHLDPSD